MVQCTMILSITFKSSTTCIEWGALSECHSLKINYDSRSQWCGPYRPRGRHVEYIIKSHWAHIYLTSYTNKIPILQTSKRSFNSGVVCKVWSLLPIVLLTEFIISTLLIHHAIGVGLSTCAIRQKIVALIHCPCNKCTAHLAVF